MSAAAGRSTRSARRLVDRCQALVEEGVVGRTASLYVEQGGRVLVDVTVRAGVGLVPEEPVHPTYCLTKPVLVLALGHLLDAGRLELDAEVGPLVGAELPRGLTLAHLLSHQAGLGEPRAYLWRMTPPAARAALLAEAPAPEAGRAAYSEVRAWYLLGRLVGRLAGRPLPLHLEQAVLGPLGVAGLAVTPARAERARRAGTIEVPLAGLPGAPVPLLTEALPVTVADADACCVGYSSASAAGRLYGGLRRALGGAAVPGVPSAAALHALLAARRPRVHDEVLGRPCAFAGGFMVGLADHAVTLRASASAFGHAAGLTPSLALADPEADLALALYLDGATLDGAVLDRARRSLTDAVYEAVDR